MDPYTLIANLNEQIKIPDKGIISHTLYNDDQLKIVLFGLAAGHEMAAHAAPVPITIMFLKGEASVTLGDDRHEIREGALIRIRTKLTHGIVAKTPVLMLLSMLKSAFETS
jgi:quercetin dioxygenase-like cupin family protein